MLDMNCYCETIYTSILSLSLGISRTSGLVAVIVLWLYEVQYHSHWEKNYLLKVSLIVWHSICNEAIALVVPVVPIQYFQRKFRRIYYCSIEPNVIAHFFHCWFQRLPSFSISLKIPFAASTHICVIGTNFPLLNDVVTNELITIILESHIFLLIIMQCIKSKNIIQIRIWVHSFTWIHTKNSWLAIIVVSVLQSGQFFCTRAKREFAKIFIPECIAILEWSIELATCSLPVQTLDVEIIITRCVRLV